MIFQVVRRLVSPDPRASPGLARLFRENRFTERICDGGVERHRLALGSSDLEGTVTQLRARVGHAPFVGRAIEALPGEADGLAQLFFCAKEPCRAHRVPL